MAILESDKSSWWFNEGNWWRSRVRSIWHSEQVRRARHTYPGQHRPWHIHSHECICKHTHTQKCTHKHTQMHFLCIKPTMLSLNWAPTEAKAPLHSPQWTPHIQGDFFNWASLENVSSLLPPSLKKFFIWRLREGIFRILWHFQYLEGARGL